MKTARLFRVAAVGGATAATALGLIGVPASSAEELGVMDAQVRITPVQEEISPPGTFAAFDVEVLQVGTLPATGDVLVTLPSGSDVDDDLSTGCTEADSPNTATCPFDETPSAMQVVATTPTTPGTYTVTADLQADPVIEDGVPVDIEDDGGNHAETTFDVLGAGDGVSAGVVRPGESLRLSLPDGREYVLVVPEDIGEGKEGVIVDIRGAQKQTYHVCPIGRACGDNGFLVKFNEEYESFTATDPTKPLEGKQTFGSTPPCQGLGNNCLGIAFQTELSPTHAALIEAQACSPSGQVNPVTRHMCIEEKYKVNGKVWFSTRLLSEDPITLPIGRL